MCVLVCACVCLCVGVFVHVCVNTCIYYVVYMLACMCDCVYIHVCVIGYLFFTDKTKWNYYPYKFLHGQWKNVGKYIIVLMIVLNSLLLSVPWKELDKSGSYVQDESVLYLRVLFIIFQAFFVLFVILNLLSDGYVYFFLSVRNTVEFLFAVASMAYIIFAIIFESVDDDKKDSMIVELTDFALGLAVVRLINGLWKFNVLVNLFYTVIATVINSIPLLGILLVVFFHYALVGTLFFSNVRTGDAIDYR